MISGNKCAGYFISCGDINSTSLSPIVSPSKFMLHYSFAN